MRPSGPLQQAAQRRYDAGMDEPSSSFLRDDGLSVVIPTLQAGEQLAPTLDCLYAGSDPLVREIVVADGGSTDDTTALAERRGARVISAPRGRGSQLAAGARAAECDWLLFLHADTRLGAGWREAVGAFTAAPENRERAGVFRFALDDDAPAARRLERIVAWRSRLFGLPYGDQGVLIHRSFYEAVGGFRPLPLMEDVDLVRRIGRRRLTILPVAAVTSAERYRRSGYVLRSLRNLTCLTLYILGVPPRLIAFLYG